MTKIRPHDFFHNQDISLIAWRLFVAAIVKSQTYMNVVQTYLLILIQIKNIEVNRHQHFDFFQQSKQILLFDAFLWDFASWFDLVAILEYTC